MTANYSRTLALALTLVMLACSGESPPQAFDTVIRGARVIDPETNLDEVLNIGITGDRITAITDAEITGSEVIDATGLVAAPGFIDLHMHGQDPYTDRLGILDGRTSQLDLEAGAWPIQDFYDYKENNAFSNYGVSVGHAMVRMQVMDGLSPEGSGLVTHALERSGATGSQWATAQSTPEQLDQIDELLVQGLRDGGLGIGVMVGYYPEERSEAIARAARVAGEEGSFLTSHPRYISLSAPSGVLGIQEMISVATSYGAPLLLHHVPTNALSETRTVLDLVDAARRNGAKIVAEAFPYVRGSTYIGTKILDPGWQERMDMDYDDLWWVETGEVLTAESFARYRRERPDGFYIMEHIKQADMLEALRDTTVIIASDGTPFVDDSGQMLPVDAPFGAGRGHPRGAGTYGTYLRTMIDDGRLSMGAILAKTSLLPARFIEDHAPGMRERGRLQEGMYADITVFDPQEVRGVAGYDVGTNSLPSEGFEHVLVNGAIVVRDGETVDGARPGRAIRGEVTP